MPATPPLEWAHPVVRDWFLESVRIADRTADRRLAADSRRPRCADLGADRLRQNACGVPRLHQSPRHRSVGRDARQSNGSPVRLAAQGAQQRRSEESRRSARRDRRAGARARPVAARHPNRRPYRRHADAGPARDAQAAAAHPRHDARVAVHPAHGREEPRDARDVRTVIVDEIHAVADDKRGATWPSRSSASTRWPDARPPHRPLRHAAPPLYSSRDFLAGRGRTAPWSTSRTARNSTSRSRSRASELGPIATNAHWDESTIGSPRSSLAAPIDAGLREHATAGRARHAPPRRTTRTRLVAAHHGSLARRIRLDAEERLKAGALRVLVATASLELGHRHRLGRSRLPNRLATVDWRHAAAHRPGRPLARRGAQGRLFPTTLDDLVECAALVRAIRAGDLDRIDVPMRRSTSWRSRSWRCARPRIGSRTTYTRR